MFKYNLQIVTDAHRGRRKQSRSRRIGDRRHKIEDRERSGAERGESEDTKPKPQLKIRHEYNFCARFEINMRLVKKQMGYTGRNNLKFIIIIYNYNPQ